MLFDAIYKHIRIIKSLIFKLLPVLHDAQLRAYENPLRKKNFKLYIHQLLNNMQAFDREDPLSFNK